MLNVKENLTSNREIPTNKEITHSIVQKKYISKYEDNFRIKN